MWINDLPNDSSAGLGVRNLNPRIESEVKMNHYTSTTPPTLHHIERRICRYIISTFFCQFVNSQCD